LAPQRFAHAVRKLPDPKEGLRLREAKTGGNSRHEATDLVTIPATWVDRCAMTNHRNQKALAGEFSADNLKICLRNGLSRRKAQMTPGKYSTIDFAIAMPGVEPGRIAV